MDRAEIADAQSGLGYAANDRGDEPVAAPANRISRVLTRHGVDARDRAEPIAGLGVIGREHDRALGTVPADEILRRLDVDDAPVLDDRDAIAQALGFLHE